MVSNSERFDVPGVERGVVCNRIDEKELLNSFLSSAHPAQRNAVELKNILPKDASLADLPVERFTTKRKKCLIATSDRRRIKFSCALDQCNTKILSFDQI